MTLRKAMRELRIQKARLDKILRLLETLDSKGDRNRQNSRKATLKRKAKPSGNQLNRERFIDRLTYEMILAAQNCHGRS